MPPIPKPATYLISKTLDPVFALFIGLSAAATRISREEKELGRTSEQTLEAFKRRVGLSSTTTTRTT